MSSANLGNTNVSEADAATALELKDAGNKHFSEGRYSESVASYQASLNLHETAIVRGNLAGAYAALGEHENALKEALKSSLVDASYVKAYTRIQAALTALGREEEAAGVAQDSETWKKLVESYFPSKSTTATEVIGIDLGTTYSCVAVWANNQVEIISNEQGARTTPSVVSFNGNERLIGQAAVSTAPSNPTNTIFDAKRFIGRAITDSTVADDAKRLPFKIVPGADGASPAFEVQFEGETKRFSPEEISAMVLTALKRNAESYLGKPVDKAVITVPAYFNDAQRKSTILAGKIAGLDVKRIINEPTAAALAYGLDKAQNEKAEDTPSIVKGKGAAKPKYVLIFDLGGGTFDVSLLTIDGGIFEVKATGGDTHLGGEDFDHNVSDFAIAEFVKKNKSATAAAINEDKRAIRRLRASCERAKRQLSSSTQAQIEIESFFGGEDLNITLTRAKFEQLNDAYFQRCLTTVKDVMKDAKAQTSEVAEIVLVGGSTRIPKVQAMLSAMFNGKELCRSINPDEAVAYGAAVQGAILGGVRSAATDSLILLDVAPLSLGIETEGGVMAPVIKRNTAIPTRKTKTFTTTGDFQASVDVDVYEGERAFTSGNTKLGHFVIEGIERAARGVPQIDVTFDLDANGVLTVTAEDKVTKVQNHVVIENAIGQVSAEDIDRMVAEAAKFEKEDKLRLERIEARNAFESLLNNCKDFAITKEDENLLEHVQKAMAWYEEAEENTPAHKFKSKASVLQLQLEKASARYRL